MIKIHQLESAASNGGTTCYDQGIMGAHSCNNCDGWQGSTCLALLYLSEYYYIQYIRTSFITSMAAKKHIYMHTHLKTHIKKHKRAKQLQTD